MKGLGTKVKTATWLLVFIILAFMAGAQNPDEKKPEKKGLASKLKQVKIPDGLGPRIPGLSKILTEEKSQEEGESEQSEEEAKFDEDEEDPDKMMEKMIRQLGHDPEMVKQMMDGENPDADPRAIVNPDPGVLAGIQPTPRNQGELVTYLKTFDAGADQAISPETAKQAGPYVGKGQQTKDAAYVFWMNGKQEAAAYWYTLYLLPQDPTGHNYRLYADYLATIARLKNSYPYPVPPLYTGNGCEIQQQVTVTPRGKLAQWEDTHCATYWDLDFHLVKSKFTCKEVQITASVEGVEFGVGQKYDPTSLETIEHSILFGGEIGKSATTLGNHLEVGVSAGAVATLKFDGSWNIKDVAIKVSAGAELGMHVPDSSDPGDSGPDIRQAASVGVSGGYEMSILTGFRGEAPQVNSIGNIFNR